MRAKELLVDIEKMKIEVEVSNEPQLIMICNGKAKVVALPEHGETKVITYRGKIQRYRFEEGEEF